MSEIKLLDCTLRDGGYINDWEFGHDNLVTMFERLVSANIDIIEIGFLDERRSFDINRSIMPDTECVKKIYGTVNKKDSMIVGMIDYGTCSIDHIEPCKDSYLDGIRVIFKKEKMYAAMEFCRQVKSLGYKVFSQLVSITSYSDKELLELIDLVNDVEPYAVSMVDTYGLLHQDFLMHYFEILDKNVADSIGIGYHSHNNFQLGYANCIELLQKRTNRCTIVVDGSLYGMGKSAGNTPVELLAMHLNERYFKHYDVSQLLEAIDGNVMQIHKKSPWGYSLFYYLAASNNCHPNYVKDLMQKHSLSMKSINEILRMLEGDKKLLYDKSYLEEIYRKYESSECDDTAALGRLAKELSGKMVLLLGPGQNIQAKQDDINAYIKENSPVIISTNFIPGAFQVDFCFVSNVRRYIRLVNALKEYKNAGTQIIATSNVTRTKGNFDYTLNSSQLIDLNAETIDNSFIMLLKVLIKVGVKEVSCAGFDGYTQSGNNYFNPGMEYWFSKPKAEEFNSYVKKCLREMKEDIHVHFITDSQYCGD